MESNKVIRMLKMLPQNELNEFGRYIRTDFFNRKEVLVNFFGYLSKYLKGKSKLLKKEALYEKLFPQEMVQYRKLEPKAQIRQLRKRLDGINYELKVHLEGYLVWKQSKEKSFERDTLLLKAWENRQANDLFFEQYERSLKGIVDSEEVSLNIHLNAYVLQQQVREHPQFHRWNMAESDISHAQDNLDIYYLGSKLMNAWIQLLQLHLFNRESKIHLLNEFLELAHSSPFKDNIFIDCYSLAIEGYLNQSFNLDDAEHIRKRFTSELQQAPRSVQVGIFNLLMNYHILTEQFNGSSNEHRLERFSLMKYGLEHNYLIRGEVISYADFHNTVALSIQADSVSWGEGFVAQYGANLREDIRRPTILLSKAKLKMASGRFRESLQLLTQKNVFTSHVDKFLERIIRIQCYYELNENDLLEHSFESTRKYCARSKEMGSTFRVQINEFLRITKALHQARQMIQAKSVVESILLEIPAIKTISERDWLCKKATDLIG